VFYAERESLLHGTFLTFNSWEESHGVKDRVDTTGQDMDTIISIVVARDGMNRPAPQIG